MRRLNIPVIPKLILPETNLAMPQYRVIFLEIFDRYGFFCVLCIGWDKFFVAIRIQIYLFFGCFDVQLEPLLVVILKLPEGPHIGRREEGVADLLYNFDFPSQLWLDVLLLNFPGLAVFYL